ncbi:MAG: hypothetical protein ABSH28_07840 [Acidobacteriota bacterium]|jgi:hypothetical protein
MEKRNDDNLRDQLLNKYLPPPGKLDSYRKEVNAMLEREEKALRSQKIMVVALWLLVVGMATVFMVVGGYRSNTLSGIWLGISACFWFLFGMVFLFQYHMNRSRLELLKEIKQIQLQVLELRNSPRLD